MSRKRSLELTVFFSIVVLDQLVKAFITSTMHPGDSIPIVEYIFHITYVLNPGAAFGIFSHQRAVFIALGLLILCGALYSYSRWSKEGFFVHYGTLLLLGGAIGNLIDRVRSGLVIDFFDFRVWPVFNVADIAIVTGVASILYAIFFRQQE